MTVLKQTRNPGLRGRVAALNHRGLEGKQGGLSLPPCPSPQNNLVTASYVLLAMPKLLMVRRKRVDESRRVRGSQAGHIVPAGVRKQRTVCAEGDNEPAKAAYIP